jgi:hypothetical protein
LTSPYASTTCGIWHGTAGDTAFYVNNNEVTIRNLAIVNSNATQGTSASRGVYYQHAGNTIFEHNSVYFFGRNLEVKNGGQYYIEHNEFMDATGDDDVLLQDSAQHDEGDGFFERNYMVQLSHNITNQVEYRSGGGIHFNYNKGNALHHATAFFYAPFVGTIIMEAIGNGSEQCNGPEFWVAIPASGTLGILKIQSNYMDGSGVGAHIVVDGSAAGATLTTYQIDGNVIAAGVADTGILLKGIQYGGVGLNTQKGGFATVVTTGTVNENNHMGFKFYDEINDLAELGNKITMNLGFSTVGYITGTANDTLVLVGPKPGGSDFTIRYTQDATGGHSLLGQGFGENFTGSAGGFDPIAVDPRPLKTTYIKGHINPNGAATIYQVQRVMEPGAIPFIGSVATNGLAEDSGRFVYDQVNRNFKLGLNALAGNMNGSAFQLYGSMSMRKDSLQFSSAGTVMTVGYDTVSQKFVRNNGGGGTSYTFSNSLVNTSGTVTLVNDNATPGNSKYYGTNSSGTLGYFSLGSATAVGGDQAIQYDSSGVFSGNTAFLAADYTNHKLSILNVVSATTTDGLLLATTSTASSGLPKWSPALRFRSQDWTGSVAHNIDWIEESQAVSGADQGSLNFSYQVNGGTKTQMLSLTTGGFMDYNANSQTLGFIIRQSAGSNYTNIGQETIGGVSQVFLDATSTPTVSTGVHIQDNGSMGLGAQTLFARFMMYKSGNVYSLANDALSGVLLYGAGWTYNDNSTAASGTVSQTAISAFGVPTITATNSSVTYTNAYTLYVAGDPVASTNVSITNKYAFQVGTGTGTHTFLNSLTGVGTTPISSSWLALGAPTTALSSINLAAGTAVTSPNQGDLYATTGHLFYRDQSTTYDLLTGATTPTLQSVLTAGSTLTTNNTISMSTHNLDINCGNTAGAGLILTSSLAYDFGGGATDADRAIGDGFVMYDLFNGITANRNITLPSVGSEPGRIVIIHSPSTGSFNWVFSTTVTYPDGSTITTLKQNNYYTIRSTGAAWVVIGEYGDGVSLKERHTIFTPTTGGTVTTINNQNNIVNPSGTLATLTIALPSSPNNNDVVKLTFTQAITAITYSGGTVVGGPTSATLGGQWTLNFDSGTSTWY